LITLLKRGCAGGYNSRPSVIGWHELSCLLIGQLGSGLTCNLKVVLWSCRLWSSQG